MDSFDNPFDDNGDLDNLCETWSALIPTTNITSNTPDDHMQDVLDTIWKPLERTLIPQPMTSRPVYEHVEGTVAILPQFTPPELPTIQLTSITGGDVNSAVQHRQTQATSGQNITDGQFKSPIHLSKTFMRPIKSERLVALREKWKTMPRLYKGLGQPEKPGKVKKLSWSK